MFFNLHCIIQEQRPFYPGQRWFSTPAGGLRGSMPKGQYGTGLRSRPVDRQMWTTWAVVLIWSTVNGKGNLGSIYRTWRLQSDLDTLGLIPWGWLDKSPRLCFNSHQQLLLIHALRVWLQRATAASPRNLLKFQIPRSYLRPAESNCGQKGSSNLF